MAVNVLVEDPRRGPVRRFYRPPVAPDVPVKDPAGYQADPWRALVDCPVAHSVLGWHPSFTWSSRGEGRS
jgi:hypothetical protein